MTILLRFAIALCLGLVAAQAESATLTITTTGPNAGNVAVTPVGQLCSVPGGGTCTLTIPDGTAIRIVANSPTTPGIFSNGAGDAASCGPVSTCVFTLTQNSAITATFTAGSYPSITIAPAGDGGTHVGVDNAVCQNFELGFSACTVFYAPGSVARVEGRNAPHSLFTGFTAGTGDAAGCAASPCEFMVTGNSTLTANAAALDTTAVVPQSVTLNAGQQQTYSAQGIFTNGGTRPLLSGPGAWFGKRALPVPRFSLAAAAVAHGVYAIGGADSGGPTGRVDRYLAATPPFGFDMWQQVASMPTPREGLATTDADGFIYVFGGHTTGGVLTANVERYDPVANTWSSRAPIPTPRTWPAAATVDGVIYVVGGGEPSAPLDVVEAYDPGTDTWSTRAPMPTPRTGLAVAVVEGILYAIGGFDGSGNVGVVEAYDPQTDTWTAAASMPTPRTLLAAAVAEDIVYAIGGYNGSALGTVEAFNPMTNSWTTLGSMPQPRSQFGLAIFNSRLWAVGGLTGSTPATSVSTSQAFRPPEATWFSANHAVATVTQGQGGAVATAIASGTTTIENRAGRVYCSDTGSSCGTLTVAAAPPPPPPPSGPEYFGNGQRPSVNAFLGYEGIVKRRTTLAANSVLELTIWYGETIIPSSFSATLDGVDVTSYLHPTPGGFETVEIDLPAGRHTLELRVDGIGPKGKRRTDRDRLTFVVRP